MDARAMTADTREEQDEEQVTEFGAVSRETKGGYFGSQVEFAGPAWYFGA